MQEYLLPFPVAIPWISFSLAGIHVGLVFLTGKEHVLYQGKLQAFLFTLFCYIAVILPLITTTLAGVYAFAADARMCMSELQWKRWFQNKDEPVIRSIQESFRCCGFNSMRDRAWPFPSRDADAGACQRTTGFRTHCGPLWQDQLQLTARLCVMTGILVHVLSVSLFHGCAGICLRHSQILFVTRTFLVLKSGASPSPLQASEEQTRLLDPAVDDMRATFDRDERQRRAGMNSS